MIDGWMVCTKLCATSNSVYGIAVDTGYLYYTTLSSTIFRVNTNDSEQNATEIAQLEKSRLCGLAMNNNVLYLSDRSFLEQRILSYSINTKEEATLVESKVVGYKDGKFEDARFFFPAGVTIDKKGDLLVTDLHHIRKLDMTKRKVKTIAGSLSGWDGAFKDGKSLQAEFYGPCRVVCSGETMYLTDNDNHCIRMIKDGNVSTIAGKPGVKGGQDGPCLQATFCYPYGILVEIDTTLLVSDDNGLRRIDLERQSVSTLLLFKGLPVWSIAKDMEGSIYVATEHKEIWKLSSAWIYEKLLWIGNLREPVDRCNLARLPPEIIREIASYLRGTRAVPSWKTTPDCESI